MANEYPPQERALVRELARRVAELAAAPENAAILKRWRDVNALRRPDRAPVWCRPVGAWEELLPSASLTCHHPRLRALERNFRQTLLKREIGDDEPIASYYGVGAAFDADPPNLWGVAVRHTSSGVAGGAWQYDPPLKTEADFARLRMPVFTYNAARTDAELATMHELLGDLLPVRRVGGMPMHATIGCYIADLFGLSQMMLALADQPELMHRLHAHVRDAVLGAMRAAAAAGVITPNNEGPMTCSDPVGPAGGPCTWRNQWIMANSQEYDQVSPRMWREFCLEYQRPIIAQFGLSGYGCCESLTRKIDGVLSLPNLRIFVCSAWTDLKVLLAKVGPQYCIMWRQKASAVVFPDDVATLRRDLEQGARQLQGRPYQIVLRELQTLAGHPDRLHVWTRLAKAAAEKYA